MSDLVLKRAAAATAAYLSDVLVAPLSRRKKRFNCELGLSLRGMEWLLEWHILENVVSCGG